MKKLKKNRSMVENKKTGQKESETMKKIKYFFLDLFSYSTKTQKTFLMLFFIVLATIIFLSFFDLAGQGGETIKNFLINLYGSLIYFIPFLLFFLIFFIKINDLKNFFLSIIPLSIFFTFLLSALLTTINLNGGEIGYLISNPLILVFDRFASLIILLILVAVFFIFYYRSCRFLLPELLKLKEFIKKLKEPLISLLKSIKTHWQKQKPCLPDIKQFKKVEKEDIKKEDSPTPSKISSTEIDLPKFKKYDDIEEKKTKRENQEDKKINNGYRSPPIDFLTKEKENLITSGNIEENQKIIKKTLENFNIPVEMSSVNIGPTVTQYTLKPIKGIKLSKIVGLSNDLALALAAHPIRIEAPVPGKSLVGVEVPNKVRTKVTLRSLLEEASKEANQEGREDYNFYTPIGRDIAGFPVYFNLFKMPHLLVAGATGTGKTVFLNSLITSLIFRNSPDALKLILIDPKRVEFANYNDLPHLLCPVISNPQKAISTLNWLIIEMERRFDMLLELGVRDISTYNKNIKEKNGSNGSEYSESEIMPYIVLILDELADLMNVSGKELELKIMRLAQKARAVGIHLVLATQRPSVNVITGVIKANIIARVAFTVASQVDSRTILDCVGAEKLTGAGDMLFMSPASSYPKRIQGAYISEKEVDKIVEWISLNVKRKEELADSLLHSLGDVLSGNYDSNESQINLQLDPKQESLFYDPLYEEAKQIIIDSDRASTSLLQRRLKIGYARAARLIDIMEQKGVVGPARGSKPRKILVKKEN